MDKFTTTIIKDILGDIRGIASRLESIVDEEYNEEDDETLVSETDEIVFEAAIKNLNIALDRLDDALDYLTGGAEAIIRAMEA